MAETINRLEEEGSPAQEMLWVHTWAGNQDAVRELLEEGVDVNGADDQGYAALHFAVARGHVDITKLLLLSGADVNQAGGEGQTALHPAVLRR